MDQTVKYFSEKIAFEDERKKITFGELQTQAKVIASQLVRKSLIKKPIIIYLKKGVDIVVSFLGVAYSCNFYSPIDADMPVNRINKILEVLNPSLVITTTNLKENFRQSEYEGEFLLLDKLNNTDILEKEIENARQRGIDTDLLYVLFTSGSTGTPKGVTITHRSVIDYIDWVTETFSITSKDSFGNQAPFYFDNSILDIYSTIKMGATTFIIPKELFAQPVLLLNYLKEKKINTIFWVPSALIIISKLKALRNVDLSNTLKRILFCGEVMPNKHLNIWRKYLPKVQYVNLYGPTEITDACTFYIVNRQFKDEEVLPIGNPIANTDILVLNEKDELVNGTEVGELCVRGTSLSMGYYNNPEKTKEVFVQNPLNTYVPEIIYRTGDLVRYNEYGEIVFLARKDYQIKHRGHRIELGEIETAVSSLEEISLCCCLYDEKRHNIVLFIVENLEKSFINDRIKKIIPEYMLPDKVVKLELMPINANGKIDRIVLKNMM